MLRKLQLLSFCSGCYGTLCFIPEPFPWHPNPAAGTGSALLLSLPWTLLSEQGIIPWLPTLPPAPWGGAGWVWQPGWLKVGSDSSRSTELECCRGVERSFSNKCGDTNMLEPCVLFNCSPRKEEFLRALLLSEPKRYPSASGILPASTFCALGGN